MTSIWLWMLNESSLPLDNVAQRRVVNMSFLQAMLLRELWYHCCGLFVFVVLQEQRQMNKLLRRDLYLTFSERFTIWNTASLYQYTGESKRWLYHTNIFPQYYQAQKTQEILEILCCADIIFSYMFGGKPEKIYTKRTANMFRFWTT